MSRAILERLHPEVHAGGFPWNDPRLLFYLRVNALLESDHDVLEFGAGRGKWASLTANSFLRKFTLLQGRCRKLVGFDVDDAVLENTLVDETAYAAIGQPLPFEDNSFDLIVSFAVFEHVADPEFYAAELNRVLKPGGWICAWTPNKWGYVGIGARIIPNRFHDRLLKFFIPKRKEEDTFPTTYRLNTIGTLNKHFRNFQNCSYIMTGPPAYHANNIWLARFWRLYNRIVPSCFGQMLHVFLRKNDPGS